MNQEIWVDCIDKLSDLGFDVDAISTDALPTFPLSQDSLIEPIILRNNPIYKQINNVLVIFSSYISPTRFRF